jgi:G3E family GTPase
MVLAGRSEMRALLPRLLAHGNRLIAPRSTAEHLPPLAAQVVQPDEASRTPGCGCCAVRVDLLSAVEHAVLHVPPPRHLIIAVDLDDPVGGDVGTVVYTLLSDVDLARRVHLDGVVVTCDAVALATRHASGCDEMMPSDARRREAEAWALADRVLVARTTDVTGDALETVTGRLRAGAPFATVHGPGVQPVGGGVLFGIEGWHGAPPRPEPGHADAHGPTIVELAHDGALDPGAADDWFDDLVAANARRLIRFQGAVRVAGDTEPVCCHGVRSYAMSHPMSDHAPCLPVASRVVIVGWELDRSELAASFEATLA